MGLIKRLFFVLLALGVTACQPSYTLFATPDPAVINSLYLNPNDISATQARRAIDLDFDRTLTRTELHWLVTNQTLRMAQLKSFDDARPVYFAPNGQMTLLPSQGRVVQGSWWIEGDQVCYGVDDGKVCSQLKVSTGGYQPFLYFVRTDGRGRPDHATAVVVGRHTGTFDLRG